MALITNPQDLIRMYLANAGKPSQLPVPEGTGDMPDRMADPIKALKQAPLAPGYVPGGGTIVPTDQGGGREKPQPLRFERIDMKTPSDKVEEEALFKAPIGWKDSRDEAVDRAKKALDSASGGGAEKYPDRFTVPTPLTPTTPTGPAMTPTEGPDTGAPNPNKAAPTTVTTASKATFVQQMTPLVLAAAKETGLDPRLIMAQMIVESRYGQAAPGHNYFGIKSHGQPGGQTLMTTEYVDGKPVRVPQSFRAYGSPAESVTDYAQFVKKNPIYAQALAAKGMDAQIAAMAPYATDPKYTSILREVANSLPLMDGFEAPPPEQRARGGHIKDLLALSRNYHK